jgi:3-deoxy-manno-octulosonate cytidylyltransferase (CMP-KDO synthetase)
VAEVAARLDVDLIVNIQGDEPEMEPAAIDALIGRMAARPDASMGSLACPFANEEDVLNPACVKVVLNGRGDALYFSRSLIPHPRDSGRRPPRPRDWLLHLGIYAYRSEALQTLSRTPPTALEQVEQLEQLRALYLGYTITMAVVERSSTGIDTPEQYAAFVRRYRAEAGIEGVRQFIAAPETERRQ